MRRRSQSRRRRPAKPARPFPWRAFWVHFVLGGLLGAALGLGLWVLWHPAGPGDATLTEWCLVGATALLLAVPAGLLRGRFWAAMGRRSRTDIGPR